MKSYKNVLSMAIIWITGIGITGLWITGSLLASSAQASNDTSITLHNERKLIAFIGTRSAIDKVVQAHVANHQLRLLRNYPTPEDYLEEGGLAPAATLRLYEVTLPALAATKFISNIIRSEQEKDVLVKTGTLDWLSYLPNQVLVSGDCGAISTAKNVLNEANPDLNLQSLGEISLNYRGAATACIAAFTFNKTARVITVVDLFNQQSQTLLAEPNTIATGAQYIAGSPGGPQKPAQSLLSLRSPFTSTGQGVRIYAFDSTTPYILSAPVTRTVEMSGSALMSGTNVLLHAFVPLPTNLPNAPAAAGHGPFVLSPILQLVPDAEIHLVRTLNGAVFGDTWTLIRSLDQVLHSFGQEIDQKIGSSSGVISTTIFNYSFGLAGPNQPLPGSAFVRLLDEIDKLGITQIGAAGNDSAYTSQPLSDILPALHPSVISVGAVTKNGQLACYSNRGEISALGGGLERGAVQPCHTDLIVANCNLSNERCVSAWVPRPQGATYSWGVGTSFATPIVTAIAAQLASVDENSTPKELRNLLQELARKGCDPNTGIGCSP